MKSSPSQAKAAMAGRTIVISVLVAALGYFVDIYDLLLFSIVRIESLKDLGLSGPAITDKGLLLLNMQMGGLLVGGILWGVLGDKRGRLSVLFGSIFLYSLANLLNGMVHTVEMYALLRMLAGIGLAGELGAGITLVSETLSAHGRGYGTTIVATVGLLGAVVAATIATTFPWRICYYIGGGLGLGLLLLRISLYESGMFSRSKQSGVRHGDFGLLLQPGSRLLKYLNCILIGLPIWYVIGILITLAPEFGTALGMPAAALPKAGEAVKYSYIGLAVGDLASGALSQFWRSRKKVLYLFLLLTGLAMAAYFSLGGRSLGWFYGCCGLLGFAVGYWAMFVTVASEQFGTNIRATVTTTVPNFIRGTVIPLTTLFAALKGPMGYTGAGILMGLLTLAIAAVCLYPLQETFGKDLDYSET